MFSIWMVLVIHLSVCFSQQQEEPTCIENYEQLKDSLRSNKTNNIQELLDAFYPPNESTVHWAFVRYYCVNDSFNCTTNYTYIWAENAILLVHEYELLNALTLNLFDLRSTQLELNISPFCTDVDEVELLFTLTTWLKSYANSEDETIQNYASYYDPLKGTIVTDTYNTNTLKFLILAWLILAELGLIVTLHVNLWSKEFSKRMDKQLTKLLDVMKKATLKSIVDSFMNKKLFPKNEKEEKTQSTNEENTENTETPTSKKPESKQDIIHLITICRKYSFASFFFLSIVLLYDLSQFITATKINIHEWLAFFPMPILGSAFLFISIIPSIIVAFVGTVSICKDLRKRKKREDQTTSRESNKKQIYYNMKFWFNIISIPFISTLGFFMMSHGLWIILLLGVYPDRIITSVIFVAPLLFSLNLLKSLIDPLKDLIEEHLEEYIVYLKREKENKLEFEGEDTTFKQLISNDLKKFFEKVKTEGIQMVIKIVKGFIIFLFNNDVLILENLFIFMLWSLLLAILYVASNFLLFVTDIRNDPIKLLGFTIAIVGLTNHLNVLYGLKNDNKSDDPKPKRSQKNESFSRNEDVGDVNLYDDVDFELR